MAAGPEAAPGRRTWGWLAAALIALLVVGLWPRWVSAPADRDPAPHAAAPSALPSSALRSGNDMPVATAAAGDSADPSVAPDPVDRLWVDGSLRGTALDGDWGRWVAGRLQPGFGLRQRFDQLLSTQGEVPIDALRRWVAVQVTAVRGSAGAAQVLDLWDRYLQVQSARYALEADPGDPTTWQPALAEHSRVRRQLLGSAWAEAFYGAEERELAADAARRQAVAAGGPAAAPIPEPGDALLAPSADPGSEAAEATRLQTARALEFGADAADRLRANDVAWRAWQQRIDAARATWAAIERDPALSPPQRHEAEGRLLTEQFSPDERVRARSLVGASPPVGLVAPDAR